MLELFNFEPQYPRKWNPLGKKEPTQEEVEETPQNQDDIFQVLSDPGNLELVTRNIMLRKELFDEITADDKAYDGFIGKWRESIANTSVFSFDFQIMCLNHIAGVIADKIKEKGANPSDFKLAGVLAEDIANNFVRRLLG